MKNQSNTRRLLLVCAFLTAHIGLFAMDGKPSIETEISKLGATICGLGKYLDSFQKAKKTGELEMYLTNWDATFGYPVNDKSRSRFISNITTNKTLSEKDEYEITNKFLTLIVKSEIPITNVKCIFLRFTWGGAKPTGQHKALAANKSSVCGGTNSSFSSLLYERGFSSDVVVNIMMQEKVWMQQQSSSSSSSSTN
jgi:hypothetical protein